MADEVYYEVEQFLERKVQKGRVYYLVRWRNFPPSYDSWEPAGNLRSCQNLFRPFEKTRTVSKVQSMASKLLKKSRQMSYTKQQNGAEGGDKKKDKKTKQILARQKVAAELKSKSKQLARFGKITKAGHMMKMSKGKPVKSAGQKSESHRTSPSSSKPKSKPPGSGEKKKVLTPGQKRSASETPLSKNKASAKKKAKLDDSGNKKEQSKKKSLKSSSEGEGKKSASKSDAKKSTSPSDSEKKGPSKSKKSDHGVPASPQKKKKSKTSPEDSPDFCVISDSESDDDEILYSLAEDAVMNGTDDDDDGEVEFKISSPGDSGDVPMHADANKNKSFGKNLEHKKGTQSSSSSLSSPSKRMSLIDFKKPKITKQKPGPFDSLLRPSSPTPFFTPLNLVSQSPLRGSLPSPSTLNMDSLVGDVPAYQAAPVGPISPSNISYKSLLDSLPSQLHPKGKGKKKENGSNGASTSSGGSQSSSTSRNWDSQEPVERRVSVRATECVFRYKQIVVKKCHRYTQIWLNTQTTMKNAFNPQVVQEVVAALNTAKYDDSSLVLFSSIGSFFCSGVDLHFLTTGDRRVAARQMVDALRELTKAFITFPKPVIAGVGGSAVGLGVALLCLCDVVYSSDKAAFHLPYAQLSQTPEGCSSFTLPLAVGLAAANELLFGGRRITAMEAYQIGLVSHVFWPTAFMQEVIPRAQNMASCSAKVLEGTKMLIRSHHRTKMELTNETECNLLLERWSSGECQRAMEAYLANENNFSS